MAMGLCNSRSVVAPDGSNKVAVSLRCKSWTCEHCAPKRQAALIDKAKAGEPNRIVTLTSLRQPGLTAEQAARELVAAWKIIFKEIRKQHGNHDAQFLTVFEATKLDWPHLHILMRSGWIDQKWLSARMKQLTASPVCDVRRVHSKRGAARYVAKYVAKGPGKFGTLKRYWCTPAYEIDQDYKNRAPLEWQYHRHSLAEWIDAYRDAGFQVEHVSDDKAIAHGANIGQEAQPCEQ